MQQFLDYSGRISNGIWVGYASDARSTGSAIVESSGSNKTEYKDPIIYPTHPDVQTLRSNLALRLAIMIFEITVLSIIQCHLG
jgi:hypothetical protein